MPSNVRPVCLVVHGGTPAAFAPRNQPAVSPAKTAYCAVAGRLGQREVSLDDRPDTVGDLREPASRFTVDATTRSRHLPGEQEARPEPVRLAPRRSPRARAARSTMAAVRAPAVDRAPHACQAASARSTPRAPWRARRSPAESGTSSSAVSSGERRAAGRGLGTLQRQQRRAAPPRSPSPIPPMSRPASISRASACDRAVQRRPQ